MQDFFHHPYVSLLWAITSTKFSASPPFPTLQIPFWFPTSFFMFFRLRYTNQAFSGHVENAICKTITFVLFISAAGSKANSFLPWLDAIESLISKIRVKPWQKLAAWWKLELPLKHISKQKYISKDCTDKWRILMVKYVLQNNAIYLKLDSFSATV